MHIECGDKHLNLFLLTYRSHGLNPPKIEYRKRIIVNNIILGKKERIKVGIVEKFLNDLLKTKAVISPQVPLIQRTFVGSS